MFLPTIHAVIYRSAKIIYLTCGDAPGIRPLEHSFDDDMTDEFLPAMDRLPPIPHERVPTVSVVPNGSSRSGIQSGFKTFKPFELVEGVTCSKVPDVPIVPRFKPLPNDSNCRIRSTHSAAF